MTPETVGRMMDGRGGRRRQALERARARARYRREARRRPRRVEPARPGDDRPNTAAATSRAAGNIPTDQRNVMAPGPLRCALQHRAASRARMQAVRVLPLLTTGIGRVDSTANEIWVSDCTQSTLVVRVILDIHNSTMRRSRTDGSRVRSRFCFNRTARITMQFRDECVHLPRGHRVRGMRVTARGGNIPSCRRAFAMPLTAGPAREQADRNSRRLSMAERRYS